MGNIRDIDITLKERPVWRLVVGILLFVIPGLMGWFVVLIPNDVGGIRLIAEFSGMLILFWWARDVPLYGGKRGSLIEDYRHRARFGLYALVVIVSIATMLWTANYLGYISPEIFSGGADIDPPPTPTDTLTPTPTPSPTPTSTPSPTPIARVPENSSEMFVGDFVVAWFEAINNAGNLSDVELVLSYLAPRLRNENDSEWWFERETGYTIYTCEEQLIIYVGLLYYWRGNDFTTPQNELPDIIQYTMDKDDGEWVFSAGDYSVESVSSMCSLYETNLPKE